jgi:hypothetical protein
MSFAIWTSSTWCFAVIAGRDLFDRALEDRREVHGREPDRELARARARDVEQVVDEASLREGAVMDRVERAPRACCVELGSAKQPLPQQQGRDRRAQLVRHRGEESILELARLLGIGARRPLARPRARHRAADGLRFPEVDRDPEPGVLAPEHEPNAMPAIVAGARLDPGLDVAGRAVAQCLVPRDRTARAIVVVDRRFPAACEPALGGAARNLDPARADEFELATGSAPDRSAGRIGDLCDELEERAIHHGTTIPWRRAMRTRSTRLRALSLCMTRWRWVSTVRRAMNRRVAMSSFEQPSTINENTSRSREVRCSSGHASALATSRSISSVGIAGGR